MADWRVRVATRGGRRGTPHRGKHGAQETSTTGRPPRLLLALTIAVAVFMLTTDAHAASPWPTAAQKPAGAYYRQLKAGGKALCFLFVYKRGGFEYTAELCGWKLHPIPKGAA